MAKGRRQVICVKCGRRFTPGIIYHYDSKSRRYTCNSCYNGKSGRQPARLFGQKAWAFVLKVFFGLMFILVAFSPDKAREDWLSTSIFAAVIGLAIFAWAAIPALKQRQIRKEAVEYAESLRHQIENQVVVCPHCGARTKGNICEYCGSKL